MGPQIGDRAAVPLFFQQTENPMPELGQPPTRRKLIASLLRLMRNMQEKLESDMAKDDSRVGEKETIILMRMVNATARLIELDAREQGETAHDNREIQDIRNKLLQRIDELKRV
jgi:hypothetical protein